MYSSYTTKSPGWGTQETNPIFASRSSDDSGQRLKIDVLLLAPRSFQPAPRSSHEYYISILLYEVLTEHAILYAYTQGKLVINGGRIELTF